MDDLDADLVVRNLLQRRLDGLRRALHVCLDDEVQLLHFAFLELREQALERDLLVELVCIVLDLLLALLDQLARHALIGDSVKFIARRGYFGKAGNFDRNGRACVLDRQALVVRHHAHAADSGTSDDEVSLMERAVLDKKRRDGASGLIESCFEHAALTGSVRVGLELEHFGGQEHRFEKIVDAVAGLRGDFADLGLAAPISGSQTVLGQLGEDAVRVRPVLIHLVDGHDDGNVRGLGVVDGLNRLRHDAVVGRNHEDRNIRAHCAARAHLGKCRVARGIEEGDGLVVYLDGIRANVLGDAAGLARCDLCVTDIVEKGGLAVIDMAHDDDDRRTGDELFCRVLMIVKEFFLNCDDDLALDLAAELHGYKFRRIVVDGLVDRRHHAVFKKALDDLCRRFLHARRKLADSNFVRNLDDQRRFFRNLQLQPAHLLLLLGAVLGAEFLRLLLFVLVADLLLAARVVLHALRDKRIDAVVVAVGVDGNGAGIDDAAFALALGLRLFGLLGSLRLGVLLRRGSLLGRILRARLILLRLRTGILLRALVVIVLARAVRVRAELRRALRLLLLRVLLRGRRLFGRRCSGRFGFRLFLRLGGREDLGDGADLVLCGDIVEDDVQLIFCQILRTALGLIIKLSDDLNEALGGHAKIVSYLFDFLLDLNTHTATS